MFYNVDKYWQTHNLLNHQNESFTTRVLMINILNLPRLAPWPFKSFDNIYSTRIANENDTVYLSPDKECSVYVVIL